MNIDIDEIEHFDNMAHLWWDKTGPCAPLHDLNPTRLQFITDRCSLANKLILDIGCGGGILTESLALRGGIVTGIDASQKLIEVAKLHAKESTHQCHQNIIYENCTAESFANRNQLNNNKFDIITCMELLEHVPNAHSLIKAISSLLKPGGYLFVSTLNRTVKSYLLAILGAEYALKLLPKGTHTYEKLIRPSEINQWLTREQLILKDISGLQYNPFTKQSNLNTDVSVNYMIFAERTVNEIQ